MHHIAILDSRKPWLEMILSGKKTIESRWYKTRRAPWKRISKGDTVWFKKSGKPVSAKVKVQKALFFKLEETPSGEILKKYGNQIGMKAAPEEKKYCILIFLKDAKKVEPFNIDKKRYGSANAWIITASLKSIIKNP